MFLRLKTQVAMRYLILILSCVVISSIAFSNENYSAEYQGVKILTNDGYEPNDTSVILEIIDTCAYLHYSERTDTFLFRTNLNNWKIYRGPSRASNANKRMKISKDSIILQVDNHQGNTLFYNRVGLNGNIENKVQCMECNGEGVIYCYKCGGTGNVLPNPKGGPDAAVGICPKCHGTKSLKKAICQKCSGSGQVIIP